MKKNTLSGGAIAVIALFILSLLIYIAAHAQQIIGSIVAYLPRGSWRSAVVLLARCSSVSPVLKSHWDFIHCRVSSDESEPSDFPPRFAHTEQFYLRMV